MGWVELGWRARRHEVSNWHFLLHEAIGANSGGLEGVCHDDVGGHDDDDDDGVGGEMDHSEEEERQTQQQVGWRRRRRR